jgi:phage RecT family recombinase
MAQTTALDRSPKGLLQARMGAIVKVLPAESVDRFKQAAMSLAMTPGIADCSGESVVKCIYECARLNLIPDPVLQQVAVVGFNNSRKGVKEATLIPMYKGLLTLARRAEPQLYVNVDRVYTNDDYELVRGSQQQLVIRKQWWEKGDEPGEFLFSYCVSAMPGQEKRLVIVSRQQGMQIAKKSRGGYRPGSVWHDNFEAMCDKTTIRMSAKLWSMSPTRQDARSLARAVELDEADSEDMESPADIGAGILDGMGGNDLPEGHVAMGRTEVAARSPEAQGQADVEAIGRDPAASRERKKVLAKPASTPPQPPPTMPAAKTDAELRKEALTKLGNACADALDRAGLERSVEHQVRLMQSVAGDNPKEAINAADRAKLLGWMGDLNALTPEQVKQVVHPTPIEQPQTDDVPEVTQDDVESAADAASTDEGSVITYDMLASMWADIRGIPELKASQALRNLLTLRYSKDFDSLTPEELSTLKNDIGSGKIKFQLFEAQ